MKFLVIIVGTLIAAVISEKIHGKSDAVEGGVAKKGVKRSLSASLGYGYACNEGHSYGTVGGYGHLHYHHSLPVAAVAAYGGLAPQHVYNSYPTSVHTTITKHVPIAVPHPVPVTVEKHVPVPVEVPRPYPVQVPRPIAVPVDRPYAVPVDRPYPVAVPHPVPVPVYKHIGVPVVHPLSVPVAKPISLPIYNKGIYSHTW